MNYTLTQAIDRAKDLSGIIKAARAHEADCAADHEAKKNIAEIAGEAHAKAAAACVELEQEREQLAEHIAALVRKVGEPVEIASVDQVSTITLEAASSTRKYADTTTGYLASTPVDGADAGFNSIFAEPADFQAQALQNGAERITDAFNEATR